MFRSRWRAFTDRWRAPSIDPELHEARLNDWYRSIQGEQFLASERSLVAGFLGTGYVPFLVQLDSGAQQSLFSAPGLYCKTNLVITRRESQCAGPCVQSELESLPLQPESVDCLVVHHALEFAPAPHRVLREAVQALRPGGQIILFGFNPYGVRVIRRWFGGPGWRRSQPWEGSFLRPARVIDWCHVLGCEVTHRQFYVQASSSAQTGWKSCVTRLKRFLHTLLPFLGDGYVVVARKQQLIPLQPKRWETAFFLRGRAMNRNREDVAQ